ncbi:hypothetical protein CUU66_04365 [Peribacillus deserti]|uniref:CDP-glycerol--glycerophosphate glycerophosphotransferase n=1 Tax=Peribacillus deserti TaxID=673318 RepID=A0A2N5M9N0_9BACI|nr:hypothetical protein CUU66_04365 [Peribacillus deserti]
MIKQNEFKLRIVKNMELTVNHPNKKKILPVKFLSSFKRRMGTLIQRAFKFSFRLVGKLPAKKNLVIFESFLGKQYSCNPRAIFEYIEKHHPEYDMYWSVDKRYTSVFDKEGIPYLKRFSLSWLLNVPRAQYWVSNSRMPLWIPKPKHTTYLQTWHGTPLKKLAADMKEVHMPGTKTENYKRNFLAESSKWDYLISPNPYSTEIFSRAFAVDKSKIIESGYPRNDILYTGLNAENITDTKKRLGISLDKKVVLYAPTWRDDQFYSVGKYKFELQLDLNNMKQELGDDYVILLRLHYLIADDLDLSAFKGFAYNLSRHGDINELYLISDLLITDYSSVFFDFANLKRPMIFYVYDIETYRDKLRGFYFDFESQAPGPLVKTTEEIIAEIKMFESNGFNPGESMEEFNNKFCGLEDGRAAQRVVERVFQAEPSKQVMNNF